MVDGGSKTATAYGEAAALLVDDKRIEPGVSGLDLERYRTAVVDGVAGEPCARQRFICKYTVGVDEAVGKQLYVDGVWALF